MKVGLTGGIASGKSATASLWRQWGTEIIDSDEIARQVVEPGQPAHREVVDYFGTGVLRADGKIDRAKLGEIVFGDAREREKLNQIVHPRVREQWKRRVSAFEATPVAGRGSPGIVAMIPLLYETNAQAGFDSVVVVACRVETQRTRLESRGLTDAQATARIGSQMSLTAKMEKADFVIWNEYSLDLLEAQARAVWRKLFT